MRIDRDSYLAALNQICQALFELFTRTNSFNWSFSLTPKTAEGHIWSIWRLTLNESSCIVSTNVTNA